MKKRTAEYYISLLPESGDFSEVIHQEDIGDGWKVSITLCQDDIDIESGAFYQFVIFEFKKNRKEFFYIRRYLDDNHAQFFPNKKFSRTSPAFGKSVNWLLENEDISRFIE
jgi:hypothetical protein